MSEDSSHEIQAEDLKLHYQEALEQFEAVTPEEFSNRRREILERIQEGEIFYIRKYRKNVAMVVPMSERVAGQHSLTGEQRQKLALVEDIKFSALKIIVDIVRGKLSIAELAERMSYSRR